jgi:hypothetical protein
MKAVLDWCEDHFPVSGSDINCSQFHGGTTINFVGIAQGLVSIKHPFKLLDKSDDTGHKIQVVYGNVNSQPPVGMVVGDDPAYILNISLTAGVIFIGLTVDVDGVITSLFINQAAALPANTGTLAHLAIGFYTLDTATDKLSISQSISGSQMYQMCGAGHLFGLV